MPHRLTPVIFGGMKASSAHVSRLNLDDLARYLDIAPGDHMAEEALEKLARMSEQRLNATADAYKAEQGRRVKPTVVKRRVAALKSAWGRMLDADITRKQLKVKNPHVEAGRVEFPAADVEKYFDQVEAESNETGGRDRAIVMLLYERLLGRSEIGSLRWPADVDLKRPAVRIDGQWLPINSVTHSAIERWLVSRGKHWDGPFFTSRGTRQPLSVEAVNWIIKSIGVRAGLKYRVSPSLLWQAAIDRVFALGWDIGSIEAFCRVSTMTLKRHIARMPNKPRKVGLEVVGSEEIFDPRDVAEEVARLDQDQRVVLDALHSAGDRGLSIPELSAIVGWDAKRVLNALKESAFWHRFIKKDAGTRARHSLALPFSWPYVLT